MMSHRQSMVRRVEEYLAYRRNLGFKLRIEGQQILNFARYVDQIEHNGPLTTDLAIRWACLPKEATRLYHARRLEVVRCFAKYLTVFDPRTQIPDSRLLGRAHRRTQPHIYSPKEIGRLLRAARALRPINGLRPHTYATLVGLMASTGLRTHEALNLSREDVNLDAGILTVRETKFHKSRIVPLDETVTRALGKYARFRDTYMPSPQSNTFLLGEKGTHLSPSMAHWTFRRLCMTCGIQSIRNNRNPRLYDLRHTFCTRRLLEWHKQRVDVDHAILALSTYVGHVKVSDTYWYLSGIPELFAVTGVRFERFTHEIEGEES